MQKFLLAFLLCPCLSFCQQTKIAKSNNYIYPDSTWQTMSDAAKEGWSNDSINKLKRFIIESTNATGMVGAFTRIMVVTQPNGNINVISPFGLSQLMTGNK